MPSTALTSDSLVRLNIAADRRDWCNSRDSLYDIVSSFFLFWYGRLAVICLAYLWSYNFLRSILSVYSLTTSFAIIRLPDYQKSSSQTPRARAK
jgi:hypothetical protein